MSQAGRYITGGVVPPGTAVVTLTSNSGGAVPPNGAGNINVVGDGTTITGVGVPGTNTITFSVIGGTGIQTLTGDTGGAVSPTAGNINVISNVAAINAGSTVLFVGSPGTSTLTLNVSSFGKNTFIGSDSGNLTNTASICTGIGSNVLSAITSGVANTCMGYRAGQSITTGSNNTCIGTDQSGTGGAGGRITTGFSNTFVGINAGESCTTGSLNTGIGASALILCTGSRNVAINSATNVTTGDDNIMIRSQNLVTSGSRNTLIGIRSGTNYTSTESDNINFNNPGVALENNVMRFGVTGAGNDQVSKAFMAAVAGVAPGGTPQMVIINPATEQLGSQAIPSSSISITGDTGGALVGNAFTFTGGGAANAGVTVQFQGSGTTQTLNVTDANGNTIIGGGKAINSGNANAGIGQSVLGNCTGDNNMAMGAAALFALTSGSDNIAIGEHAMYAGGGVGITTGSRNIGIGTDTGSAYTSSETDNILIGYGVTGTLGENHVLRIGNGTGSGTGNLSQAFIQGIRGITTDVNDAIAVLIDSAGQLGTVSSSIRFKENVHDLEHSHVLELRPVSFNYKQDGRKSIGLIAEEVEKVMPSLVAYNQQGEVESVKYHDLPVLLLLEIQKLRKELDKLKNSK